MNKNRKSFIFITQTDEAQNSISARIFRIKKNKPVLAGIAEISRKLSDFRKMHSRSKKGFLKLAVYIYLVNRGFLSSVHVEGVDYMLEGV